MHCSQPGVYIRRNNATANMLNALLCAAPLFPIRVKQKLFSFTKKCSLVHRLLLLASSAESNREFEAGQNFCENSYSGEQLFRVAFLYTDKEMDGRHAEDPKGGILIPIS